ncbi:hypothetical protein JW977_03515 [Candidatus Falkowbacteria bacterium]|nr:hypothetical protein [Candidatus Falkowbacteria bacterium]
MNKKIIILIIVISLGILLSCQEIQASKFLQGLTSTATQVGYGETTTPQQYAASIIKVAFTLIGIIFTILLIYGGYLYLTSQGDEKKVSSGKKTITTAVVGLVIIISGYSITYFVAKNLEQPGATPPPFTERCENPEDRDYFSCYCCSYRNQGELECCSQSCCATGCGCTHTIDQPQTPTAPENPPI